MAYRLHHQPAAAARLGCGGGCARARGVLCGGGRLRGCCCALRSRCDCGGGCGGCLGGGGCDTPHTTHASALGTMTCTRAVAIQRESRLAAASQSARPAQRLGPAACGGTRAGSSMPVG
jgi:hypothetical protein